VQEIVTEEDAGLMKSVWMGRW